MRLINRDRTPEEKRRIEKAGKSLEEIRALIHEGVINPDTFKPLRDLIGRERD